MLLDATVSRQDAQEQDKDRRGTIRLYETSMLQVPTEASSERASEPHAESVFFFFFFSFFFFSTLTAAANLASRYAAALGIIERLLGNKAEEEKCPSL